MMSENGTKRLIERVRKHPSLYDTGNTSYKNLSIRGKRKIWESIGAEINVTGDVARKKWRSLRDNYMRYRKEIITGQATKKFSKWYWAPHLQFLDVTLLKREKPSNFTRNSQTPPPDTQRHLSSPISSQTKDNNDMDKLINFIENKKKPDAVDNLFTSYAQTFKAFSLKNQITLKVELAKLFSQIEFKEMEERAQVGINVAQTTSQQPVETYSIMNSVVINCDNELDVYNDEK